MSTGWVTRGYWKWNRSCGLLKPLFKENTTVCFVFQAVYVLEVGMYCGLHPCLKNHGNNLNKRGVKSFVWTRGVKHDEVRLAVPEVFKRG